MSEDSVRIGSAHIEVKPELDQSAVARVKAALAASYEEESRKYKKSYQTSLAEELAFHKTNINQILQANAALNQQRTRANAKIKDDLLKNFQEGLKAFEYVENLKTKSAKSATDQRAKDAVEGDKLIAEAARLQREAQNKNRYSENSALLAKMRKDEEAFSKARIAAAKSADDIIVKEHSKSGNARNNGFWTLFSGGRAFQQLQAGLVGGGIVNIAPLTAGVLALGSAFATTATASAAFGLAVAGQIAEVSGVMKELQAGTMTLDQLPASYQKLIPEIKQFQGAWHQFLADTRGPIFEDFGKGLNLAETGLQKITPTVNVMSHAVGHALDLIGQFGDGPEMASFLKATQDYAPQAVDALTKSALNFARGGLNILTGLAPAGQSMLQMLENLSAGFAKWSSSLQNSPGFQQFVAYAAANGPKVLDIFANLITTIGKLVAALAPVGAVAVNLLQGLSKLLAVISPTEWQALAVVLLTVYVRLKYLAVVEQVTRWVIAGKAAWMGYVEAQVAATAATEGGAAAQLTMATSLKAVQTSLLATGPFYVALAGIINGVQAGYTAFEHGAKSVSMFQTAVSGLAVPLGDVFHRIAHTGEVEIRSLVPAAQEAADAIVASMTAAAQQVATQYQAAINAAHAGTTNLIQQAYGTIAEGVVQKYDAMVKSSRDLSNARVQEALTAESTAHANIEAGRAVEQAQRSYAQSKQAVIDAERGVRDAHLSTIDALRSYRDAQNATKQAEKDLVQSRIDAARQLRDQAFAETNSKLALEDARRRAAAFGLYGGQLMSDYDYQKAQAAEGLTEAEAKNNDTVAEGAKLRQQGIANNPAVLSAQKALVDAKYSEEKARRGVADAQYAEQKATIAVKEAQYQEAQARQAVADAVYRQTKTLADGARARADAHQATLDAIKAERDAKKAYDDASVALQGLTNQQGLSNKSQVDLRNQLAKKLVMDSGNVPAQLQDIATYMEAIHKLSSNTSLTWQQAWSYAQSEITGKGNPTGNNPGAYHHAATGGSISGPGSGTSDSIPAMLSNGEHVWTAEEVRRAGGHGAVEMIRKMVLHRAGGGPILNAPMGLQDVLTGRSGAIDKTLAALGFQKFAKGGGVSLAGDPSNPFLVPMLLGAMNGYANGGAVQSSLGFLASVANKIPYIFGGVGPNGYDCSGLVGEIWARLTGHPSYRRYFVTANEGQWGAANGFRPGRGLFTVGYNSHHTVGRLAGHSFEAAHTGTKMRLDTGTTPESMPNVMYLPSLGGTPSSAAPIAAIPGAGPGGGLAYVTLPSLFKFPGGRYSLPGAPAGGGTLTPRTSGGNLMGWIGTALAAAHAPASWAGGPGRLGMYTLVQRESGGNPYAINKTDSNWLAGHPSVGLAQVIGPTFQSHAGPYKNTPPMAYGTSEDPVANLYAATRYIMARYGRLPQQADPSKPPRGYATGGAVIPTVLRDSGGRLPHGHAALNLSGQDEWVVPPRGSSGMRGMFDGMSVVVQIGNEEFNGHIDARIEDNQSDTIQHLMAR